MSKEQNCYSTDGIEGRENEERVRCAKSKYRLVFTDHHERLYTANKHNTVTSEFSYLTPSKQNISSMSRIRRTFSTVQRKGSSEAVS